MTTLIVESWSSKCGDCLKSAAPHETGHFTLLGYGPTNGDPGCGAEWTEVQFVYVTDDEAVENFVERNPHLIGLIGHWLTPDLKIREQQLTVNKPVQLELPKEITDLFDI